MKLSNIIRIAMLLYAVSLSQVSTAQLVSGFCELGNYTPKYAVTQPEPTLRTEWGHSKPFSKLVVYNELRTKLYLGSTVSGGTQIDELFEQGGFAPNGEIFEHRVVDIPYPSSFVIEGVGTYSYLAIYGMGSTIVDVEPVRCELTSFLTYP